MSTNRSIFTTNLDFPNNAVCSPNKTYEMSNKLSYLPNIGDICSAKRETGDWEGSTYLMDRFLMQARVETSDKE